MTTFLLTFQSNEYEGTYGDIEDCTDENDALDKAITYKAGESRGEHRGYMIIEGTVLLDER